MATNISLQEIKLWVENLQRSCEQELLPEEQQEQKKYSSLVKNPADKAFLIKLLDDSSQIKDKRVVALRLKYLIEQHPKLHFLSSFERLLFKIYTKIGYCFPSISIPLFRAKLRKDTQKIVIREEKPYFHNHLKKRRKDKVGQNVNLLGEVVLSDSEANRRYRHYLKALENPQINYLSVKVSGICAQLQPLNHENALEELVGKMKSLYKKAIEFPFVDKQGNTTPKFVNLDMEEYKDATLTLEVFTTTLDDPALREYHAGIVLQAYLPDSWDYQTRLIAWAKKRVAQGGAPIKVRLVKGANLQMEQAISSLKGWKLPMFPNKTAVDAHYLKMLDRALKKENAEAIHLGIASHNLFTIGYAHLLSKKEGTADKITFEMLEGMANHLVRTMTKLGKQVVLYAPVVSASHFLNAVSYLVRRLDENTAPDNFITHSFSLHVGDKEWQFLYEQFERAYALKDTVSSEQLHVQNRQLPAEQASSTETTYQNEPDTDFSLAPNREWAHQIVKKWKHSSTTAPLQLPIMVAEKAIFDGTKKTYFDRSQQPQEVINCELHLSNSQQIEEILTLAQKSRWSTLSHEQRAELLYKAAQQMRIHRNDLIGCMAAITGKVFMEGDVEVSEAIDFCEYYPRSLEPFTEIGNLKISPKGVILVISPWNFPLAIPVGGVVASLASGNTVILKPATEAAPIAYQFAECFWKAGIPYDALQVICPENRKGLNQIITHKAIKHIILTGGTDTAFRILEANPLCPLSAETGGKNAIITTASCDTDHAIKSIVASAFGNAGQKCSACSLLLLDSRLYDDESFRDKLREATLSLTVGGVWELGNIVGPMITNHNDKLLHAIENLEEGESWLIEPKFLDEKKYILSPSVKWGVRPENFTFKNELFGPLLAVVRTSSFEEAITLANATEYGLTAGLQSLDEREHALWREQIEAGNLYINRGITGAIVQRQPFGGMKRSAFGEGTKAGGANYVLQFTHIEEVALPQINEGEKANFDWEKTWQRTVPDLLTTRVSAAIQSYAFHFNAIFSQEKDVSHIVGEENTFRYLPLKKIGLRFHAGDTTEDLLMVLAGSTIAGTPIEVSIEEKEQQQDLLQKIVQPLSPATCIVQESEDAFIRRCEDFERVRTLGKQCVSDSFLSALATKGKHVAAEPVLSEGRVELLHYLKEQSVTYEYHRYGNFEKTSD